MDCYDSYAFFSILVVMITSIKRIGGAVASGRFFVQVQGLPMGHRQISSAHKFPIYDQSEFPTPLECYNGANIACNRDVPRYRNQESFGFGL